MPDSPGDIGKLEKLLVTRQLVQGCVVSVACETASTYSKVSIGKSRVRKRFDREQ